MVGYLPNRSYNLDNIDAKTDFCFPLDTCKIDLHKQFDIFLAVSLLWTFVSVHHQLIPFNQPNGLEITTEFTNKYFIVFSNHEHITLNLIDM